MPGGDGTGPFGTFKNCMPVDENGNPVNTPFYGRGMGRGRGFGMGRGLGRGMGQGRGFRWFNAGTPMQTTTQTQPSQTVQAGQEKESRIQALENELREIKKKLEDLKEA